MQTILQVTKQGYALEVNSNNGHKRTNISSKIQDFLNTLNYDVKMTKLEGNDLKIIDKNGHAIILENYQNNQSSKLFSDIVERIKRRKKVKIINKIKMASLTLIAFATISTMATFDESSGLETKTFLEEPIVESPKLAKQIIETVQPSEIISTAVIENNYEQHFDPEFRIKQLEQLKQDVLTSPVSIGCKVDDQIINYLTSPEMAVFIKYGNMFGVDPYILLSEGKTESGLNHERYAPGGKSYESSYAVGVMQIEKTNLGSTVSAYNYETSQIEIVELSLENVADFDTNIKIGAMILQNNMRNFNNNVYLAIQAHNYGTYAVKLAVNNYAKDLGITPDEVMYNYADLGWLKYISDIHNNPKNYFKNWKYKTYGDENYVKKVMGYYCGNFSKIKNNDGSETIIDLASNERIVISK